MHIWMHIIASIYRALRDGLLLANRMGCNGIEVNSDCYDVIEVMRNGGNSFGPLATIYKEYTLQNRNYSEIVR
jgi:hypothetical protein